MNQEWSSLFPGTDEDFDGLLDFDGLGFDFSAFEANDEQDHEPKGRFGGGTNLVEGEPMYGVETTAAKVQSPGASIPRGQTATVQVPQGGYQQHGGNQHHAQSIMHTRPGVPPTPTSMEIQGIRGQFTAMDSQQAWRMHEGHLRKQQDQVRSSDHVVLLHTHSPTDGLHTSSLACSNSARHPIPNARICDSRRILQSP